MRRSIFLLLLLAGCSSPPDGADSTAADPTAAADVSFSEREKDSIRRQIQENWLVDAGMAGLETMEATIIVEMNPDGSVQSARFDPASVSDDPNWEHFAEACRRAVLRASPLQMPRDKPYAAWKTVTLRFSARETMRQNPIPL